MNLTVITLACDRPEAMALCEKYVARQTVQPFQWLVLDGGDKPTKCTLGQEYHYWPELTGRSALSLKLRRAMKENLVKGDAIIFTENDDWEAADWYAHCAAYLEKFALFGEGRAVYYNVAHRFWFEHTNLRHASLCATAIRRDLFDWLTRQVTISECPFLDVRLWNKCPLPSKVFDPYRDGDCKRRTVGIKGMPGTSGYGGGHKGRDVSAATDLTLAKLRSLIGPEDAAAYEPFFVSDNTPPPKAQQLQRFTAKTAPKEFNMHTHIAHSECGRAHGPNWLKWLGHLRGSPVRGMELGTFRGDSAEWFLDNICVAPGSHFDCVDTFEGGEDHHAHGVKMDGVEEAARKKLARFAADAWTIYKGRTEVILREMSGENLDFIYVDADHTSRGALRDAILGFDLLKVGGVMIFDDYSWTAMPNELDRPKLGIDAFIRCYAKQLRVLEPKGYQVAVRKVA